VIDLFLDVCKSFYLYTQVGLTMAIRRAKSLPPTLKTIVQRFVPLPAVGKMKHMSFFCFDKKKRLNFEYILFSACASTCNVIFMRFHELYDGIEVLDEENKPIGVSKVAAKKVIRFRYILFNRI
jgi:hypothetical protein